MFEDRINLLGFGLIALFGLFAGVMLVHIADRSTTELDFATTIIWGGMIVVVVGLIKVVLVWNRPLEFQTISVKSDRVHVEDH